MKSLIELTCTKCGASLSINEEREYIYCQYCGTKLILDNTNEHVYRHIDEAKVKEAENEKIIRLKELELEEKKMEQKAKNTKIKLKISLVLGIIGIVSLMVGNYIGLFCFAILGWMWILSLCSEEDKKNK